MKLNFLILKDKYAIYRFEPDSDIPLWVKDSGFYSVTKTNDELSIVCKQFDSISKRAKVNKDWKVLKVQGTLDFSLVGIIADISGILEKINVSVFTISTYDTDYILVKNQDLDKSIFSLKANGHEITYDN